MVEFDWNSAESEFGGDFKPYAEDGTYEVKLDKVEKKDTTTGKTVFEFYFEEGDTVQYPKVSRFFFDNARQRFRMVHYSRILQVLGISKDASRKVVEACESKSGDANVIEAYLQTFNRAAQKHPVVKLEVTTEEGSNGKQYARGEFANPTIHFSNNKKKEESEVNNDAIDILEIPFD